MRTGVLATLFGGLAFVVVGAQQPPPVFRAAVDSVELEVVVTDGNGRPVTDLTRGDFDVLDQGRPQSVTSFAFINLAADAVERVTVPARRSEADIVTNTSREGRIYVFVLDDLHTEEGHADRIKAAARRFIEHDFADSDIAAVVFTGLAPSRGQDFTSNTTLLLNAIEQFQGQQLPSPTIVQLNNPPGVNADVDAIERPRRARALLKTLRAEAELLAGIRNRRKAIVLISEGIDGEVEDAITAATRANVVIYAIDPRGVRAAAEELSQVSSVRTGGNAAMRSLRERNDALATA